MCLLFHEDCKHTLSHIYNAAFFKFFTSVYAPLAPASLKSSLVPLDAAQAFFIPFAHSVGFTPLSQYSYILMYVICARMDTGYIMFGPTPDGWIGLVWVVRDAVGGGLWWDNPGIPCHPFGTIPFFIKL